jgi:hypothetical protein
MANRVKLRWVESLPGLWRVVALRSKSVDLWRATKLQWPVYDVWRHFVNRESKTLFLRDNTAVCTSWVQKRIIDELKTRGIASVDVGELLPQEHFLALQTQAEALLGQASVQRHIKAIQETMALPSSAAKPYLIPLLGERPTIDAQDRFLNFSLHEQMLGIIFLRQQTGEVAPNVRGKSSLRRLNVIIVVPLSIEEPTQASWDISRITNSNGLCTVTAILSPEPPQTCHWRRSGELPLRFLDKWSPIPA